jgi:lipopolysaccharide/colanic/teichoic acid biosynthesis glycosyltransferase
MSVVGPRPHMVVTEILRKQNKIWWDIL